MMTNVTIWIALTALGITNANLAAASTPQERHFIIHAAVGSPQMSDKARATVALLEEFEKSGATVTVSRGAGMVEKLDDIAPARPKLLAAVKSATESGKLPTIIILTDGKWEPPTGQPAHSQRRFRYSLDLEEEEYVYFNELAEQIYGISRASRVEFVIISCWGARSVESLLNDGLSGNYDQTHWGMLGLGYNRLGVWSGLEYLQQVVRYFMSDEAKSLEKLADSWSLDQRCLASDLVLPNSGSRNDVRLPIDCQRR